MVREESIHPLSAQISHSVQLILGMDCWVRQLVRQGLPYSLQVTDHFSAVCFTPGVVGKGWSKMVSIFVDPAVVGIEFHVVTVDEVL